MIIFFFDFGIVAVVFAVLLMVVLGGVETVSVWLLEHALLFIILISVVLLIKAFLMGFGMAQKYNALANLVLSIGIFASDWLRLYPVIKELGSSLDEIAGNNGFFELIIAVLVLIVGMAFVLLIWGIVEWICTGIMFGFGDEFSEEIGFGKMLLYFIVSLVEFLVIG